LDLSTVIRTLLLSLAIILLLGSLYEIIIVKAYLVQEVRLITNILVADLLWSAADLGFSFIITDDRGIDIALITFANCTFGVSITFAAIISYWAKVSPNVQYDQRNSYQIYM
jgi:hypothetical protein